MSCDVIFQFFEDFEIIIYFPRQILELNYGVLNSLHTAFNRVYVTNI